MDEEVAETRRREVAGLRSRRDAAAAARALDALGRAAQGNDNLLPPVIDCVEALTTVGEISDCLRAVFGQYRESVVL